MRRATARRIGSGTVPKGDVLATARLAGIMAAKRTAELIPLCHPLAITRAEVELRVLGSQGLVRIRATVEAFDRTGVEMEALTAASVAALTIVDMVKGIDRDLAVDELVLLEKSGGRSGLYRRSQRLPG
jgi:cyclic pyranopterin phosphate synthase